MRKIVMLAVGFGFGVCAFAQADTAAPVKEDNFAQRKQEALKRVDERISSLNQLKTCIAAAADAAGLKSCHKTHKGDLKDMRKELKEERMQKIGKRQKKLESRKQKMKAQAEIAPAASEPEN
ncbi:MAG: hypothetical protein PHW69_07110 [Elusimicrobiaceae bacterium]|nr:hypothetical protein [Elusimicrobiaceae bacterium]